MSHPPELSLVQLRLCEHSADRVPEQFMRGETHQREASPKDDNSQKEHILKVENLGRLKNNIDASESLEVQKHIT